MRAIILAMLVCGGLLAGGATAPGLAAGTAEDEADAPGLAYCAALSRQCGLACNESTEPGSAAAAACEARCAVERAACEARDGLARLEPWLADKADKVDRFMQGFHGDGDGDGDGAGEGGPGGPGGIDEAPGQAAPQEDEDADETAGACRAGHEACEARCAARYGDDDYARAGCKSVCALDRATCEANAGVEAAKPFIERETKRLRDFFDGFLGDDDAPPPPPEWPPTNPDGTVDL
ncbi:hypothetical protein [Roseospira goensis]|uniref:Uncharacterized protein n=1 Tax=Roseospira goensis TaxID=391922 RepID=A0A7W6WJB5_9PROT|nr:hypothetical protein [Roseospira goensis]MBB4284327.1 hypothetical protein [Roseospira goensis]